MILMKSHKWVEKAIFHFPISTPKTRQEKNFFFIFLWIFSAAQNWREISYLILVENCEKSSSLSCVRNLSLYISLNHINLQFSYSFSRILHFYFFHREMRSKNNFVKNLNFSIEIFSPQLNFINLISQCRCLFEVVFSFFFLLLGSPSWGAMKSRGKKFFAKKPVNKTENC